MDWLQYLLNKKNDSPYFVRFIFNKFYNFLFRSALHSPLLSGLYQTIGYSHKLKNAPPLIYLSDGGHLENLGLEQLLLRKCSTIIVCYVGEDPFYQCEELV